jgi:hypothetical protein
MAWSAMDYFVFGEVVTAARINNFIDNDNALRDGSGIASNAITEAKLATVLKPYVLLATATPSAANVSFTGISGSYKHLRIECMVRSSGAGETTLSTTFNGDTGTNYVGESVSWNDATATGAGAAAAASATLGTVAGSANPKFYMITIEIPFYQQTTSYKAARSLTERSTGTTAATQFTQKHSMWWASTAAITRVDLTSTGSTFGAGSTFYLYGIN